MTVLERLKRINASPPPEESIGLRVTVLVAVLAAAAAVLNENVGGRALQVACLVGIPVGFALSHLARHKDRFWLKVALAVALLVAFILFLGSVRAVLAGGSVSEIQIPLAELFLWVQVLHSMDVPARRDLLFSLVSSLTLITAAGVLSVSLGFAPWLIVWGVAALASLVLAYRRQLDEVPTLTNPVGAAQRPARLARPVLAVVAAVALLGTGAFLVVPAAGTTKSLAFPAHLPQALRVPLPGGLSNPSLGAGDPARRTDARRGSGGRESFGYFGFSDSLDTSVRGRPDNTMVMRVKAPEPDFWRGQTFDRWDGRSWTQSDVRPQAIRGASPIDLPATAGDATQSGSEFVQTFYIERGGPNLVFGAYAPSQLYFPDRAVFQLNDGAIRSGTNMPGGTIYTVVSKRPGVTAARLQAADTSTIPDGIVPRYVQLPPETPERVKALAREVTAGAPTTYDKVRALEGWMATNTRYTLNVPPLPARADAVDQFLFVDKVGFCEQIGTSLVVMLRSLGIPARLAVGFVPGERNPFTGLWEVRAKDAHAWAEVWFPGTGWQAFDPTAAVPLAGDSSVRAAGSGLLPYLLRHLPRPSAVVLRVAVLLGAAVLVLVVGMRLMGWRRRRRTRPRRSWADLRLARLEHVGARLGAPRRPEQTVHEYELVLQSAGLPHQQLRRVIEAIETESFSGYALADEERGDVDVALVELERR
ncbi:MAG TPA: transglutaminaseTgpA domain-containing protein [Acidimicrobiales bacterium]|nr:transglutaminaseTgpA domain-containing protein [Acidimicrobiales bacterium]